tara:strand:- start:398 stop:1708 length:1311 start_codon:yes stop_codon:yes gene_type:complete
MKLEIFLFEYKHFIRSKAKLYSFLFFTGLCLLSIFNGYQNLEKQKSTILEIKKNEQKEIDKMLTWYDEKISGPDDRPWVDISNPYWSIVYTPHFVIKEPSKLFPLGIGQSDQFGYYKKINRWSSVYDPDLVEETSNYEKLVNGNIDFSFLIFFLLPILIIILTYNINSFEREVSFDKLIKVQSSSINRWLISRLLFYLILILMTVNLLILSVWFIQDNFANFQDYTNLILIANIYIFSFSFVFYWFNKFASNTRFVAFKMITIWLIVCVIIPGSVHQYASYRYSANYMTDFIDANRKETYDLFKLGEEEIYEKIISIYPDVADLDSIDNNLKNQSIRRSISVIANKMNIDAIKQIENQNQKKNSLIKSTYFYNPLSYVQNLWNSYTSTDYNSYKKFHNDIQNALTIRNKLILYQLFSNSKVDKEVYLNYLKKLKKY